MPDRDDDEIDDASLSSMRSVWLSMRDEEPPAAGMSALMAAAAAKATELRETRTPWWKRAFAQLRRPPALAFATVVILIGGAVVVTRNVDDMKVEERAPELRVQDPTVAPPPPVAAQSAAAAEEEAAAQEPVQERGKEAVKEPVKEPVQAPVEEPAAKPASSPDPAPPSNRRAKSQRDAKAAVDPDSVGPNEPSRDQPFEAETGHAFDDGDDTVVTAPGIVDSEKPPTSKATEKASGMAPAKPSAKTPPEKPSVKAPPAKPSASEPAPTQTLDRTTPKVDSLGGPATSEQLAREVLAAAARGDCATVRTGVAQLRKQDEAVFQARLAKNATVARCL